jgi:hypothetical protein
MDEFHSTSTFQSIFNYSRARTILRKREAYYTRAGKEAAVPDKATSQKAQDQLCAGGGSLEQCYNHWKEN